MSDGRDVIETWFRRVWKEKDTTAIDEMFPSMGKARGLGAQVLIGPKDFKRFHADLCARVSNIDISIDMSMQEGDWTSALCTFSATAKEGGKRVQMTGTVVGRIKNGKIMEAYNHWDFMGLWEQLGYLPPGCMEKGLKGQQICDGKKSSTTGELKSRAQKLVNECLNTKDTSAVAEFYSPDIVHHGGTDGECCGHEDIVAILNSYNENFPNLKFKIEEMLQDGNHVIVRWIADADTQDPNSVDIPGLTILRYEGDKVCEIWQEWDKSLVK